MSDIREIKKSIRTLRDEFLTVEITDIVSDIGVILKNEDIPNEIRDVLILLWTNRQKDLENMKRIQQTTLIKVIDTLNDSVDTLSDKISVLELKTEKIEHIALDNKIGLPFKILGAVIAIAFLLFTFSVINPDAVTHAINGTKELVGIAFDHANNVNPKGVTDVAVP